MEVENCPGAMGDPYRKDYPYDEFHPPQQLATCLRADAFEPGRGPLRLGHDP